MPITKQQRMSATKKLNIAPTVLKGRGAPPGSGHVSKTEILQRMIENDAVRFLNGRFVDPDGNNIDPYEFTWAEFLTLVSTDYAGITIRITDRHQDYRGVGGVYFVGGTSWVLESKCIYYATLAAAPSPVTWPGLRIFAANIGVSGSFMTSDGAHYRPDGPYVLLANNLSLISRAKGSSPDITTEWQPLPVRLYRDINNRCVMQNGDYLVIHNAWAEKTGTTDTLSVQIRFGTGNDITDTSILAGTATGTAAQIERIIRFMEIGRVDNVTIRHRGLQSTVFQSGPLTTARGADITVPDMDSASDSYLNIGMYTSGLTDTALGLREYEVRLVKGY